MVLFLRSKNEPDGKKILLLENCGMCNVLYLVSCLSMDWISFADWGLIFFVDLKYVFYSFFFLNS